MKYLISGTVAVGIFAVLGYVAFRMNQDDRKSGKEIQG